MDDMEMSSDYESEDDGSEDFDDFDDPPSPGPPPEPFRCVDIGELRRMRADDVQRVAERLPKVDVPVLLRAYKWDCEKVVNAYFENPEGVLSKAGVCEQPPTIKENANEPFRCPICLEPVTAFSALGCGHRACTSCYSQYIAHKIEDEGPGCICARCPSEKCSMLVTDAIVEALATEAQVGKYRQYVERSYVDDNPRLEWCPAPTCERAIYMAHRADALPLSGAHRVVCACGEAFCFACRNDDHSPATCEQLRHWLIKCKDDSETFNWLQANTRTCPECKTAIEKNGGCNHMTCKKCSHEWCWVCTGPWKDHSGNFYTCNKYKETEEDDSSKKNQSRAALERYLHYYTRYINHHNSLKLEENTRTDMDEKIDEMQQLGSNTWLDVQYLKEATEWLLKCRHALQYTYVYAFYLAQSNHKELFEMAQRDLEMSTEDLSAEMEKPVEEIERKLVIHHQQMSKKRLANLFNAVEAYRQETQSSSA